MSYGKLNHTFHDLVPYKVSKEDDQKPIERTAKIFKIQLVTELSPVGHLTPFP